MGKKTIETYNCPDYWLMEMRRHSKPSQINTISYRRYRVTSELIEESDEVLLARIKQMWRENTNWRMTRALQDAAKQHGGELDMSERGVDAK